MTLITEEEAQETSRQSVALLASQGWCIWFCKALNDTIVVVRDGLTTSIEDMYELVRRKWNATDDAEWPAFYKVSELRQLLDMDDTHMALVHEAKKLGGEISSLTDTQNKLMED